MEVQVPDKEVNNPSRVTCIWLRPSILGAKPGDVQALTPLRCAILSSSPGQPNPTVTERTRSPGRLMCPKHCFHTPKSKATQCSAGSGEWRCREGGMNDGVHQPTPGVRADLLGDPGHVAHRKMMGEYVLYYRGRLGITSLARSRSRSASERLPPGARATPCTEGERRRCLRRGGIIATRCTTSSTRW